MTAAGARVTLWYPAVPRTGTGPARYRAAEAPSSWRTRLLRACIRTSARQDAAAAPGPHPLLVYFASWGGGRGENTALAENLARRGWCVAALDDAGCDPPMDFSTPAAVEATERVANEKLARLTTRGRAVLTALLAQSATGELPAVLDPSRVGSAGFSFGGAVAAEVARSDGRVGAALNLDGWMFGAAARTGVGKPLLVIGTGFPATAAAGSLEAAFNERNERCIVAAMTRGGGCFVAVDGSRHLGFCDAGVLPALSPHAGPIGGRRLGRIVFAYTSAFFDQYVAGTPAALFATAAAAPLDPVIHHIVWLPPAHD